MHQFEINKKCLNQWLIRSKKRYSNTKRKSDYLQSRSKGSSKSVPKSFIEKTINQRAKSNFKTCQATQEKLFTPRCSILDKIDNTFFPCMYTICKQYLSREILEIESIQDVFMNLKQIGKGSYACLLYTSPSPRDLSTSRMPSSA